MSERASELISISTNQDYFYNFFISFLNVTKQKGTVHRSLAGEQSKTMFSHELPYHIEKYRGDSVNLVSADCV